MTIVLEQMHKGGISLEELAGTTALHLATLRAGAEGLYRPVRRVQIMEILEDLGLYLGDGDLLLTTAYNLRTDRKLQRSLVKELLDIGVSGIVLKVDYYLRSIPAAILKQADELAFPVFSCPRDIAWVDVSQSIWERLSSRSHSRLQRSATVHRELVRLVVEGADLPTIVRRAAVLLARPVVVEDDRGRTLAGFEPGGEPHSLAPRSIEGLEEGLTAQVIARGALQGRVALLGSHPLSVDDQQALEQVATVIALEITKSDYERLTEQAHVAEFVRGLVLGRAGDETAIHKRAAVLSVQLPKRAAVLRLSPEGRPLRAPALASETMDRMRERLGDQALLARMGNEVVAVLSHEEEAGLGADRSWLPSTKGRVDFAGGLGEETALTDLPASYWQAGRAVQLARAIGRLGGIRRFTELEAYDVLLGELDADRAEHLHRRTLGLLSNEFRETVAAYLECGSIAETAKALYLHRNSVHYRLRRIQELTGLDLGRVEDRLLVSLALLHDRLRNDPHTERNP